MMLQFLVGCIVSVINIMIHALGDGRRGRHCPRRGAAATPSGRDCI